LEVNENFVSDACKFYSAVVQEIVNIFPFDDRVINYLVVLDPTKCDELMYAPSVRLAELFVPLVS